MNSTGQCVEFARFRTKPGVTDEQLIEADARVREGMLQTFEGYQARELYRGEDGDWTVVLRFANRPNLEALMAKLKLAPDDSFKQFGALIDRGTMRVDLAWKQA